MRYPGAVIFVNNDLTEQVKGVLAQQLRIFESMTGTEFDARVAADPNYPSIMKNQGLRILIIRDFWAPHTNRTLCDIAIFVKNGLAYIEENKFGPPGQAYPVANLHINKLV